MEKTSRSFLVESLNEDIARCEKCVLGYPVVKTFGRGPVDAKIMFVGECPWMKQEWSGMSQEQVNAELKSRYGNVTSFGDIAGKKLSELFGAANINEDEVYVTNAVKCSMPGNVNPRADEMVNCNKFLTAEVGIVKPKVVLAASHASRKVFEVEVDEIKGSLFGYVIIGAYHPSYVVRFPSMFGKAARQYNKARLFL